MKENWLEIRIEFNFRERCKMLLDFVKPTILSLDEKNLAETFHFFFEPHLLLRIRTQDKETISKVKPVIEENLKHIENLIIKKEFNETYYGEQANFGEKGWEIAQKFFEYGSRISLLMNDPEIPKEREFHEGKFVHCFLNTLGYAIYEEAIFHHRKNLEKWLRLVGYFDTFGTITPQNLRDFFEHQNI